MSQVRCDHTDECPNGHLCRHAKQHTKDEQGHSGSRAVGCCHPVPKGNKCIVKDCPNHKGEGRFVGDLCGPCHAMLTTGTVGHGETFIHKMRDKMVDTAVRCHQQGTLLQQAANDVRDAHVSLVICSEREGCPEAGHCLHAKWHQASGRGHGFGAEESQAVGCRNKRARCE